MSDVPVSRDDVESLGQKLGDLESQLSDKEKALLLGVIAVASESITSGSGTLVSRQSGQSDPIAVEVEGQLPPLRDQFVHAFTPGRVTEEGGAAAIKWEGTAGIKVSGER